MLRGLSRGDPHGHVIPDEIIAIDGKTLHRSHDRGKGLADTLAGYVRLYNHQIPQKALGHVSPIQALKDWQQKCPERFKRRVYNLAGSDSESVLPADALLQGVEAAPA